MTKRLGICLLLLTGCTRTKQAAVQNSKGGSSPRAATSAAAPSAAAPAAEWPVAVAGEPRQLRLKAGSLTFCDDRGGQQVDLATGRQSASGLTCTAEDEQASGMTDDGTVEVSSPNMQHEANDRVCIDLCYFLNGRAHDWENDGKTVVVGTGSEVEVIDGANDKVAVVGQDGGDRVAIGSGWIAWRTDANKLRLISEASALATAVKR